MYVKLGISDITVLEKFLASGVETPGEYIELSLRWISSGGEHLTPTGHDLRVTRNGVEMTHSADPALSDEFSYDPSSRTVLVIASGDEDRFEVTYKS